MITIQNVEIPVNVRAELEAYPWERATWTDERLTAVSPFRYDKSPSFYVYLTDTDTAGAGNWGDSGASDPEWQRGGIVKLLGFLRNETYAETVEYLHMTYGKYVDNADNLHTLNPLRLAIPNPPQLTLSAGVLVDYRYRSSYLGTRGITEGVQRLMNVGYDRSRNAVTIPWHNADGTLGNVKYRRVDAKTFWYAKGGRRLSEMVYGMNIVYERRIKRVVIVEAEIDAMSVMVCGTMAIAVGGTAFTRSKAELIRRSPLEEIVILRDNDAAGRLLQRKILAELIGYVNVRVAVIPRKYGKDANDALMRGGTEVLRSVITRSKRVCPLVLNKFIY
jgi:5S rRNA maturation endonuclease (ribonuclease M5)